MSRFTSASESRRQFPTLAENGPDSRALKGTVSPSICHARHACERRPGLQLYVLPLHLQRLVWQPRSLAERCLTPEGLVQIVYYDGQFDDSRLCTALACTAALAGATMLNHTSVTSLIKVGSGGSAFNATAAIPVLL